MTNQRAKPTAADVKVSQSLQGVAAGLEECLQEIAGERYGFALFVFPFDRMAHGSYVSNAEAAGVEEVLRVLHERVKNRLPTPALHRINETDA